MHFLINLGPNHRIRNRMHIRVDTVLDGRNFLDHGSRSQFIFPTTIFYIAAANANMKNETKKKQDQQKRDKFLTLTTTVIHVNHISIIKYSKSNAVIWLLTSSS